MLEGVGDDEGPDMDRRRLEPVGASHVTRLPVCLVWLRVRRVLPRGIRETVSPDLLEVSARELRGGSEGALSLGHR